MRSIRRLEPNLQQVAGIELYMQPVQDLTVEDLNQGRTQYQYMLDAPDKALLDLWAPRLVDRMKQIPELRDVATDQQNNGVGLMVNIDRDTSGRLGITPQNVDDALYDAFGQRQVSTIYTQTNQFHVILEVDPKYQQDTSALGDMYVPTGAASANLASTIALAGTNTALTGAATIPPAPLGSFVTADRVASPIAIDHSGLPVPGGNALVQSGTRSIARLGGPAHQAGDTGPSECRPALKPRFQGTAKAFESSLRKTS